MTTGRVYKTSKTERDRVYAWRAANPGKHLKSVSVWKQANPEKVRKYKAAWEKRNPASHRGCNKRYYEGHRLEELERARKFKEANPTHGAQWKRANLDRLRVHSQNRAARLRQTGGSISLADWLAKLEQHGYLCVACGVHDNEVRLTMDHITPISCGGPHGISNIQPLCGSCNSRKGARSTCKQMELFESGNGAVESDD